MGSRSSLLPGVSWLPRKRLALEDSSAQPVAAVDATHAFVFSQWHYEVLLPLSPWQVKAARTGVPKNAIHGPVAILRGAVIS